MKTISSIEVDKSKYKYSDTYIDAVKSFFGSLYSDIGGFITNKNLVGNTLRDDKVAETLLSASYKYDTMKSVRLKVRGYHRELFSTEYISFNFPCIKNGKKISKNFLKNEILLPLVNDGFFDDEYYMFILPLLFLYDLAYDSHTGKVGYKLDEVSKDSSSSNIQAVELNPIIKNTIDNNELLQIEVEQGFINREIGDPSRGYGFTHKIREMLNMQFFPWQRDIIKQWNKINVVFAVRNSGKTAFACYIALREIISGKTGFGIRQNRKILYFVPDKVDIGEQVIDYIEGYIDAIFDSTLQGLLNSEEYLSIERDIDRENARHKYISELAKLKKTYFRIDRSKYQVTCNITGNKMKIISLNDIQGKSGKGLGTSKGEGLACDVYIIDEAPRIPDSFWKSFWERASTESEYGYISGTLNLETPKDHWTYQLALRGELGDKDISSHRIALWNNETLFMHLDKDDIEGREKIIAEQRKHLLGDGNYKNLYCRGYGIILNTKKVIDLTGCIIPEVETVSEYDRRILVIDFGGDNDPVGWLLYNITKMMSEGSGKFLGSIKEQIEFAQRMKDKYADLDIIGDGTGAKGYVVMGQDKNSIVDIYMNFSSGPRWSLNNKGSYSVDKGYMVKLVSWMTNNRLIRIPSNQTDFIAHCKSLIRLTPENAAVQKFGVKVAKGEEYHHADIAMCLLMLAAYLREGLGLSDKDELQRYGDEIQVQQQNVDYLPYNYYDNGDNNFYSNNNLY